MRLDTRYQFIALALFGVAAVLVMILASSVEQLELSDGLPIGQLLDEIFTSPSDVSDGRLSQINLGWFQNVIAALLIILLPISIVYVILNPKSLRRILRQLLWIFVVFMLVFAYSNSELSQRGAEDGDLQFQAGQLALGEAPSFGEPNQPPVWLEFTASLALAAVLLAVGLFLWRRWRASQNPLKGVVREAHVALDDLRSGADVRDVVLRCYFQMGQLFQQRYGLEREQAMTAREFEEHLAAAGLMDEHVRRLTRLFESVRYSPLVADANSRREAQECLEALVQTYGSVS